MALNPPGQYTDDRHLAARQRLWGCQVPAFDVAAWVLDLAGVVPGMRVLDAGCGNGLYLRALRDRRVNAAGCDLSPGMLRGAGAGAGTGAGHPALVNADVTALPVRDGAFDAVLAAQLLDLVEDRGAAVREVRRSGLLVISLNMAGSVPEAADLVVTDPVQAGVMAVMAVADTAKFTVERLKRRVF